MIKTPVTLYEYKIKENEFNSYSNVFLSEVTLNENSEYEKRVFMVNSRKYSLHVRCAVVENCVYYNDIYHSYLVWMREPDEKKAIELIFGFIRSEIDVCNIMFENKINILRDILNNFVNVVPDDTSNYLKEVYTDDDL